MMNDAIPLNMSEEPGGYAERSDAVANRRRILEVTRRLFAEYGPTAVSMSDIVKAAGVGRGTLYRHFPDKGALCLAVMDEEIAEFQNEVLDRLRQMTAVSAPAMAQLDEFLDRLVWFTETYTPLLREAQAQGLHYFEKKEGTPQYWQQATVLGLLRTAVSQNEILPDTDIDYLADAVLAPLNPQLFHYQRAVQQFSPERISDGLRAFVAQLHYGK
ncbi:MAG: TetR/AcrR family transcriptional regulator [Anaerolineales bacterium]|nr:TetR/AcrR family transcriptional regulator [Anaerolineales bacterium]